MMPYYRNGYVDLRIAALVALGFLLGVGWRPLRQRAAGGDAAAAVRRRAPGAEDVVGKVTK